MQREEFSERAQTQKMDTNQGGGHAWKIGGGFQGNWRRGPFSFSPWNKPLVARQEAFGAWLQATYGVE